MAVCSVLIGTVLPGLPVSEPAADAEESLAGHRRRRYQPEEGVMLDAGLPEDLAGGGRLQGEVYGRIADLGQVATVSRQSSHLVLRPRLVHNESILLEANLRDLGPGIGGRLDAVVEDEHPERVHPQLYPRVVRVLEVSVKNGRKGWAPEPRRVRSRTVPISSRGRGSCTRRRPASAP